MKNNIILETARLILSSLVEKKDTVVDATMGNGNDTIYLADLVKHVYAFDIQQEALIETKKRIEDEHIENVTLILDSHENILKHVIDFKGVIFNLGYLPKGDKNLTTTKNVTIQTLNTLIPHMKNDDFILLVIYPGHEEGMKESIAINDLLSLLNQNIYKVLRINLPYQKNYPPYINLVKKIKDESI